MIALRVWLIVCLRADEHEFIRRSLTYFFFSLCLTFGWVWMAVHAHPIMGEISLDLDQNYIGVFYSFHL